MKTIPKNKVLPLYGISLKNWETFVEKHAMLIFTL